jgi:hypothetical protein
MHKDPTRTSQRTQLASIVNIVLKYEPNSRPTQIFIKQIYNICGGEIFRLHRCYKFV